MTEDQRAEYEIINLMSEKNKFAIQLGYYSDPKSQEALERLMEREWIRLIDIAPLANHPVPNTMCRIFLVTQPARDWFISVYPPREHNL